MLQRAIEAVDENVGDEGSVVAPAALSQMERVFCDIFVANGGKGTEAAIAAGYSANGAHVQALRLLCRKRVSAYITSLCQQFVHSALPVAIQTLVDIASDPEALRKDRIKAATCLLEHGGMAAPKGGVQVNVGVAVDGQRAQALIASIHEARTQRLSDIPVTMPDRISDISDAIDALEFDTGGSGRGGVVDQGPVGRTPSIPPHSSTNSSDLDASTPSREACCECEKCRSLAAAEAAAEVWLRGGGE